MRLSILACALSFAACSSPAPATTATPPATTSSNSQPPAPPPADAAPPLDDCAEACTQIAGCWEEQNPGSDYHQGGFCVSECEAHAPEQKKAFFGCVEKNAADCAAMLACE